MPKNLPALKAWAVDFHRNRNAVLQKSTSIRDFRRTGSDTVFMIDMLLFNIR